MDNKVLSFLMEGLSWRDSLEASELTEFLNAADRLGWSTKVNDCIRTRGMEKTLHLMEFSARNVTAWGVLEDAVLSFLGLQELTGLSCDMSTFLKEIREKEPANLDECKSYAKELARQHLAEQVASGDVYLLKPSEIQSDEFLTLIPQIIEERKRGAEVAQAYMRSDGYVDMFSLLEIPIATEFLVKSGVGGRCEISVAREALYQLYELGIIGTAEIADGKHAKSVSIEEQYDNLFSQSNQKHGELLRGIAMALDPDETLCRKGLEMIKDMGHQYAQMSFVHALEREDIEIQQLAINGLGNLGSKENVRRIAEALTAPSKVAATACVALGKLRATDYVEEIAALLRRRDQDLQTAALLSLATMGTDEAERRIWEVYTEFGMTKFAPFAKRIAKFGSETSFYFLLDLLLLDVRSFVNSREIMMLNMILQNKDEETGKMISLVIEKFREEALKGLGEFGDSAVPVLVELLRINPETSDRLTLENAWREDELHLKRVLFERLREAKALPGVELKTIPPPSLELVKGLGLTRSQRAVPYLEQLACCDDLKLAMTAIEALSEIDTPAIDALINIPETNPAIHMMKVRQIGTIVHPKATKWLIQQLSSDNPLVRMEAAMFLAMRNDKSLSKYLLRAATDPSVPVRVGLANVITLLGLTTYPDVIQMLEKDSSESVRKIITRAKLLHEAESRNEFWA